jgi:hypothetical protein
MERSEKPYRRALKTFKHVKKNRKFEKESSQEWDDSDFEDESGECIVLKDNFEKEKTLDMKIGFKSN